MLFTDVSYERAVAAFKMAGFGFQKMEESTRV